MTRSGLGVSIHLPVIMDEVKIFRQLPVEPESRQPQTGGRVAFRMLNDRPSTDKLDPVVNTDAIGRIGIEVVWPWKGSD